jgi:hypothetical protein
MSGGVLDEASQARLPTASTCMNLLKLPPYRDAQVGRARAQWVSRGRAQWAALNWRGVVRAWVSFVRTRTHVRSSALQLTRPLDVPHVRRGGRPHPSSQLMRAKLLYAINSGAGFDLS